VIVLDASVLIAHLDAGDAHHERAVTLLLAAADEPLGASPITVAEVLVGPARSGRIQAARGALADLGLVEIELGSDAAGRLASLRAETDLRLPDCCVLYSAELAPATAIATFDARLAARARAAGIGVASSAKSS